MVVRLYSTPSSNQVSVDATSVLRKSRERIVGHPTRGDEDTFILGTGRAVGVRLIGTKSIKKYSQSTRLVTRFVLKFEYHFDLLPFYFLTCLTRLSVRI